MNDIIFDCGVPMMEGTWINYSTGDKFTVRDSYFEDNNYRIMTTDGRCLSMAQVQNYIRVGESVSDQNRTVEQPIPATYSDIMTDDLPTLTAPITLDFEENRAPDSLEYKIIDKAFNGKHLPIISVVVEWSDYPAKKIDLLQTLMDVSSEDIAEYVFSKIDLGDVPSIAKKQIADYLESRDGSLPKKGDVEQKKEKPAKSTKTQKK